MKIKSKDFYEKLKNFRITEEEMAEDIEAENERQRQITIMLKNKFADKK